MIALRLLASLGCLFVALSASGGDLAVPMVHVTAPRAVRIAFVEAGPNTERRSALRQALAERLGSVVARRGETRSATPLIDLATAVRQLETGDCDAVVVVGPTRPRAFRRSELPVIATDFGRDYNFEPAYLILPEGDPRLHEILTESFPLAVAQLAAPTKTIASR